MGVVEDYPKTMLEFEQRFASEKACQEYLYQMRWPKGFIYPRWRRLSWQCPGSFNLHFSSTGKASFFFQPVQLHRQLADLLVERGLQGFFLLVLGAPPAGEDLG